MLSRSTKYELMALIVTLRQVIRSNLKTYETKLNQQILEVYANANSIDEISQKSQISSIKNSIKEVEDLSVLIEKHFSLTHELILGQDRKHELSVSMDKYGISDNQKSLLGEKLSDLALQMLDQYGLVKRYTRQNKLEKLEKLRVHILERERNERNQKVEERKTTNLSLESEQDQNKVKEDMAMAVYNPQLIDKQKMIRGKNKSPKNSQKLLKGKEFKF